MCVLIFDVFNGFSFVKKINWQRNVKHLLLRKTDVLKICRKSKFLGKKMWRNALPLKSKKVKGIFGEKFILGLSSAVFLLQNCVSLIFILICFAREIKGFYQSSLENEVDFRDIMNVSPNILDKIKISKTETWFCRWKSTDNNNINIFLPLENPCTFLLAKGKTWKRIFYINSELSQNRTKNKLCHPKQQ